MLDRDHWMLLPLGGEFGGVELGMGWEEISFKGIRFPTQYGPNDASERGKFWSANQLKKLTDQARHVLSRTGFVPGCEHYYFRLHADRWHMLSDIGEMVDADAAVRLPGVYYAWGDPPAFSDLPSELQEVLGGSGGVVAWALEFVRSSPNFADVRRRAESEITGFGHLARHLRGGDERSAISHLAWLLEDQLKVGWRLGQSAGVAQERSNVAQVKQQKAAAAAAARPNKDTGVALSVEKRRRREALWIFVEREERRHGGKIENLSLARLAHKAFSEGDDMFEGVPDLIVSDTAEDPRELAKEIGELRIQRRGPDWIAELDADAGEYRQALSGDAVARYRAKRRFYSKWPSP